MRVTTKNGPHDGRVWDYPEPLPPTLICYEPVKGYHEYGRVAPHTVYYYLGWVGCLPL